MNTIMIPLFLVILLYSCTHPPRDVRTILNAAGDNRSELETVINHYKVSGDREKLKATYFLIGNMDNKYTIDCDEIKKYDPIFSIFDSLEKINIIPTKNSPYLKAKWDSLVNAKGPPSFQNAKIIPDYSIIKADYLIENIDISFKLREESRWGKKISFEKFCEFVLPYRFNHEPLEQWRSYFYKKYRKDIDSINASSCYQLAMAMNRIIPKAFWYLILMAYPYDIPNSKMVNILKGSCRHIAIYNATAMRAFGLPVGADYSPLWGNLSGGHKWNVLFLDNDKPLHFELNFERKKDTLSFSFDRGKPAKIFRETFGRQDINFTDLKEDAPESLLDNHRIDVTHEYTKVCNINIPLRYSPISKKRYSVICTFNNKNWVPQDWGKIKKKQAYFKNMGTGILYLAMYYDNGSLYPASDPFILMEDGQVTFLLPAMTNAQNMRLIRKFPCFNGIRAYCDNMCNGNFQGANNADFSDSVTLFTITKSPEKIETALITNPSKFRYVRYRPPFIRTGDVAELEFFGGNISSDTLKLGGKVIGFPKIAPSIDTPPYRNALDGDLETYFGRIAKGSSWAGLDLGTPKRITKIKYCPRSDTNFILVGDTYELCYWYNGEWVSMGEQVAKDQFLRYKNVPSGGLYILHNLTRGREERIFTYENGKQIFW